MNTPARLLAAALAALPAAATWACSSCGCSLSADWDTQGLSTGAGLRFDLRYDDLNQDQVRHGTSKVSSWPVAPHEQELYTRNRYVTATIDYSTGSNWGVTLMLPYVQRSHGTNGFNYDGTDAGTSSTGSLGDVRMIARYQGLTDERNLGLQFGLKLPTGSFTKTFSGGAIAGQPLDRGLQPGSGTTDLMLGAFHFSALSQNWDYFVQGLAQLPLNSRDSFRPGQSLNANLGWRYLGFDAIVPQLQVNARVTAKDSGANATPEDSGGKTVYLSPGLTVPVTEKVKAYAFLQLPVYQNLNGFQLAPRYTVSVGTRIDF